MSKRIRFFIGHLLTSFFIALNVIGIIFFIWYPDPIAQAVGVTNILLMLLFIDVIIGPFLGLLVYKENKKTLKMDLSVIIVLQLSALGYGVYTIEKARPIWIAYYVDQFQLIKKNEIFLENIHHALPEYQHIPWLKPQFVGVEFAKDKQTRSDDMLADVLGGISIARRPERYVALNTVKKQIQQHSQSLALLNQFNEKTLVKNTLAKYPKATAFVPLKANAVDMTVLINKEKGEVVKIVDLRPWK